jgi:hypothetical protein
MKIGLEHRWSKNDSGKPNYRKKNACPSATLSTITLTWTGLGWNPGLRFEGLATNRVNHYRLKLIEGMYEDPVRTGQ